MIDQKLEQLLPKTQWSMYQLVRMASRRALELSEGRKNFIDAPKTEKITTVALKEIAEGKVVSKVAEDLLAKEEHQKEQAQEQEQE